MSTVNVLDHPLIQHKLAILRSKNTSVKEFRELIMTTLGASVLVMLMKMVTTAVVLLLKELGLKRLT